MTISLPGTGAHAEKPVVLVVDDTPEDLSLINDLLAERYTVKVAPHGARALKIARSARPPDLILLDILMPDMDGYEVCRQLKADPATAAIPVIFLTAKAEETDEQLGFDLGAVDYITKPASPSIVLARVKNHLMLKASADFLRDRNGYMEREIVRRTDEINALQDVTILTMASLAETRDNETGNHILRTQHYVKLLAERLQHHPRFAATLDADYIELLFKSAPLHDIGKVGIPDRILLKPGKLDVAEFEIMKTHAILGHDAIAYAERRLGVSVPFLECAKEISGSHHEKWDGSGYPRGLKGDEIPLSARLMALADVYDALISRRVYKAAKTHQQALEIIQEGRGSHFDPDIFDAFMALQEECQAVAARYADSDADLAAGVNR